MTIQMILNVILTLLLPIMIWIGYGIAQWMIQRMPQQQAPRLEQFARMAVQHVEQNHSNALDKKALASGFATSLFKALKLPEPLPVALDIAIGSAMFEAARKKDEK